MLAKEDGPWGLFQRLRQKLAAGFLKTLVTCFYCLSVWIALPFALFLKGNFAEVFVGWLALSGAAILAERLIKEPFELRIEEQEPWDAAAKR
jgi:hypothetical protein